MHQSEKFWLKLLAFASEFTLQSTGMATVHESAQQQGVTARCPDGASSNARPRCLRRFNTDPLPCRRRIFRARDAESPRAESEPTRQLHERETKKLQLPPSVKPPPPLPTRFRIDGAVDPGFFQVEIHNHLSGEKIAQYSLDFIHTWAALKQSLELTLFRSDEMRRRPTVMFMEPMENTIDLKGYVLVLMRKNGLPRIAVAVDAPANLPKAPSVTLPKAPPANLPKAPSSGGTAFFDLESWSMQHPETEQPPSR